MECQTCSGMKFVSKRVPEMRTITTYVNPRNGFNTPSLCGGVPVRQKLPTGRTVTHLEPCHDCQATGLALNPAHDPSCTQCHGTGERNAWASTDEYETEPCQCMASAEALEVA